MRNPIDPKLMYRESAVRGATPTELVVILYDSAIADLRQAVAAMKAGDIEARAKGLHHALLVLQQLQGTLDFERGGSAARQFEQFYSLIRAKILEAQMRNSQELMQEQIRFLKEVRDCWMEADHQLHPRPGASVAALTAPGATAPEGGPRSKWSA